MMLLTLATAALATPYAEPNAGDGLPYTQAGIQGIEQFDTPLIASSQFYDHSCLDDPNDGDPYHVVRPWTTEDGHYYAKRIVPPATPYFVDEVTYFFHDQFSYSRNWGCDGSLAHDVVFFLGTLTDPPDASPVEVHRVTVSQTTPDVLEAKVVALDPPIRLDAGESLWVAVEMISGPNMSDPGTCIVLCPGYAEEAATDVFWSNAVAAPYPWMPLSHYGHTAVAPMIVTGRYPVP